MKYLVPRIIFVHIEVIFLNLIFRSRVDQSLIVIPFIRFERFTHSYSLLHIEVKPSFHFMVLFIPNYPLKYTNLVSFLSHMIFILIAYIVLTSNQKLKNHLGLVHLSGCFVWWAQTDLNCRPTDYESAALTN